MDELAHWDCSALHGNTTVSRPEPNSTPEQAVALLLEKIRLVHGEQDWPTWKWEAREYGATGGPPRVVRFRYARAGFVQVPE